MKKARPKGEGGDLPARCMSSLFYLSADFGRFFYSFDDDEDDE